ncbi:hypothetical protein RB195_014382 [Necator americanus]
MTHAFHLDTRTVIIILLSFCFLTNAQQHGNFRLRQAVSKPGTQHIPTEQEYNSTVKCFSWLTSYYNFTMTDNKLPPMESHFITRVMLDSQSICKNFRELDICLGGRYKILVDFDCLTRLTYSNADALFYLRQLSLLEFYCSRSVPFIQYHQCMDRISDDNKDAMYGNCTDAEWDNCMLDS